MRKSSVVLVTLLVVSFVVVAFVSSWATWKILADRHPSSLPTSSKLGSGGNSAIDELIARGFAVAWREDPRIMDTFCSSFPGGMNDGGHYVGFNDNPYGIYFSYTNGDGSPVLSPNHIPSKGDAWEVRCGGFAEKILLTEKTSQIVKDYYFGE